MLVGNGTKMSCWSTVLPNVYNNVYVASSGVALRDISVDSESPNYTFTGDSDGSFLLLNGSLSVGSASDVTFHNTFEVYLTPGSHTADIGNGSTATVDSIIREATTAGGIYKTGPGTLILNGANAFTGGVSKDNGWLLVGNDRALGPARSH